MNSVSFLNGDDDEEEIILCYALSLLPPLLENAPIGIIWAAVVVIKMDISLYGLAFVAYTLHYIALHCLRCNPFSKTLYKQFYSLRFVFTLLHNFILVYYKEYTYSTQYALNAKWYT